jgi:hypothetical protein
MRIPDIIQSLHSLRPYSEWTLVGTSYDGLKWLDQNQTKPTEEEIELEIERLKEEYDNLEYQRLRKDEYPPIEDQLDMIYHKGIDGWKLEIDNVKNKYPKPQ